MEKAVELAEAIRKSWDWDMDILKKFCTLAGLEEELEQANFEEVEEVVWKAAKILEVDEIFELPF